MNIVLVIDQFDDGNNGTTVTARRYAHELRKLGHRVTILPAANRRNIKSVRRTTPSLSLRN